MVEAEFVLGGLEAIHDGPAMPFHLHQCLDSAQLADEILEYMLYDNEFRSHQALSAQSPKVAAKAAGHIEMNPAISE